MDELYSARPANIPADLAKPDSLYKRQAWLAAACLIIFGVLYFGLAGWFVWTAIRLVQTGIHSNVNGFLDYLVAAAAAFLAVFMLKALFFIKHGGRTDTVEITALEQPRLFEFLNRLADEAGAPRPRHVFLSARVNAAVFYDLSILNLLLPSKKNLEIGLPLVNVLTLSEFKAVLAHEFGHFAQRSMAIGIWVYIAQQIAGHIIARRDILDRFIQGLSRVDLRVAWMGWLLSLVVWSIRSLLDSLFRLVVLAQRALSRQMEFQADLVAVSITGSDELIHALHKLQTADQAWDRALRFANAELANNKRAADDLFEIQSRIIEKLATILGDPDFGQPPQLPGQQPDRHRVFKASLARPPQMWSTHPGNADREENAKKQYCPGPHDERSPWLLFDDVQGLRQMLTGISYQGKKLDYIPTEQALQVLDEHYNLLQLRPDYRGAYLDRSPVRHAARVEELYDASLPAEDVDAALKALYPPSLADQVKRVDELQEELTLLEALHLKVFEATGNGIIFRGRSITRRDLPRAIKRVKSELAAAWSALHSHDRACRSVHLAIAGRAGSGWREYLLGLLAVLHYADHALADTYDAQGLLRNTLEVVTAAGKVSRARLRRLLGDANALQHCLAQVHREAKALQLDPDLRQRLHIESWAAALGDCKLPMATEANINNWLRAIDSHVGKVTNALSRLSSAALEQLLQTEAQLGQTPDQPAGSAAPAPSTTPARYAILRPGDERKRQQKLDLWARFMRADGWPAAIARLGVAGGIVALVLGFGAQTGTESWVSVYNGLGTAVTVQLAEEWVKVPPFSGKTIEVELHPESHVTAYADSGATIERFAPGASTTGHFVYNVAEASPIVSWTAAYGSAPQPGGPQFLAPQRWQPMTADDYFTTPPQHIESRDGSGSRQVLTGIGQAEPAKLLSLVSDPQERRQIIQAHAKWDESSTSYHAQWVSLASAH